MWSGDGLGVREQVLGSWVVGCVVWSGVVCMDKRNLLLLSQPLELEAEF